MSLPGASAISARALGIDHAVGETSAAEFDIELAFDAVERGKVEGVLGPYRLARGQRLGARRLGHLLAVEREAEQSRYRRAIDLEPAGDDGRSFARIGERDAAADPAAANGQILGLQLDGVIGRGDLDRADDGVSLRAALAPRPATAMTSLKARAETRRSPSNVRAPSSAAPRGRRSRRTAPAPWPRRIAVMPFAGTPTALRKISPGCGAVAASLHALSPRAETSTRAGETSGLSMVAVISAGAARQLLRPPSSSAETTSRPLPARCRRRRCRRPRAWRSPRRMVPATRMGARAAKAFACWRISRRQIEKLHQLRVGILVRRAERSTAGSRARSWSRRRRCLPSRTPGRRRRRTCTSVW